MRITSAVLVLLWVLGWPRPALAEEKLGKVTFPISCGAAVSAQFERGVAMLHSYWFVESRKVFDAIVQQDASCAMAYWGLAVTALGNSLAAPPAPKDAAAAWAALEKARAAGAKTQRERDWIEAIAAYYRDHDSARSALEIQPDYHHATDFMVYAHLQLGQDVRVKALVDAIAALPRPDSASVPGVTAITAIPARYVLERGDWAGAAGLRMTPTGRPQGDSLTRFTRGLGMARSGDLAGAKGEVQAMQALRGALATSNQSYWAERTDEQMLAVSAWVALAEGATDQAVKLMRAAADGEDGSVKHVAMENRL